MTMIRKSLAAANPCPFCPEARQAAGIGGSDHYDGNNWNKQYAAGFNAVDGYPLRREVRSARSARRFPRSQEVASPAWTIENAETTDAAADQGSKVVYVRVRCPY